MSEKIIIEQLIKYFDFSDTISGTQFLIRNIITSVSAFLVGGIITLGSYLNSLILILLGVFLTLPVLWFVTSTLFKRIKTFFPKQVITLTAIITLLQFFTPICKTQPILGTIINIILLTTTLLLIFNNSKTKIHKG